MQDSAPLGQKPVHHFMTSASAPAVTPPASHAPAGEKALSFPLGETLPALGQALEVAPGILWIRMQLPFALDHINLWLLEDSEETATGVRKGWTAVDCGVTNPGTQAAWEQVFAGPMKGLPILRVLVTHMHPDHMGLAHWLCEQFNAPLWMSATEYQAALLASTGASNFGGLSTQKFFADHGWREPSDQQQIKDRVSYYAKMVPTVPEAYHRLMHDRALQIGGRTWRCISGFGHSPEHIALYSEEANVLISGDMVLPKISTNVKPRCFMGSWRGHHGKGRQAVGGQRQLPVALQQHQPLRRNERLGAEHQHLGAGR